MNPLVTVVIPTCRQPVQLRACLLALAEQKLSLTQFDVIILDRVNDWATKAVVSEVSDQTGLQAKYVTQQNNIGVVAACNKGWQMATSRFVAFTHEDCLPRPLWLTTALPLFHQGAEVVIGRVQYSIPKHPKAVSVSENLLCRRSVLEQVGGFDEAHDVDGSGHIDWLDKLAQIGVVVMSCPDAVVVRPGQFSRWIDSLKITLTKFLVF